MVASLFSKGQASTIGLHSTSMSPLPIAYTMTLRMIPTKGEGRRSGKNARPKSPAAEQISDATMLTLYPIRSTYFAQNRSTNSCVKKKKVDIKAIFPSEIL